MEFTFTIRDHHRKYSAHGLKRVLFQRSRESFASSPGGQAAGDPCATSSSAATWLATCRAKMAAYFGSNCEPLGTRGALYNAPMMRCSTSQTLEGL